MRKAYLFIYSTPISRDAVKNWANNSPLVKTWRFDLPSTFYLISEASAQELYSDFSSKFGRVGRYLFSEIHENRQGRLPSETWYLFRDKQHKPQ